MNYFQASYTSEVLKVRCLSANVGSRHMIEGCTGKPNNLLLDLRSISSFLDHRYHPLQIRQITKTPRSDKVRVDQLFLKLPYFAVAMIKHWKWWFPKPLTCAHVYHSTCLRNIISHSHYTLITWLWCQEVDRMVMELRVRGPGKPVTWVQDCVPTSVRVTPLDILND